MRKYLGAAVNLVSLCGALSVAISVVGCGRPQRPAPKDPVIGIEPAPLTGSLTENVRKIQSNKWAESCDRDQDAIKKELAAALDAKQAEIQKYLADSATNATDSLYKKVNVGPTYFRERFVVPAATPGWQEYRYSWKGLHVEYQAFKSKSVEQVPAKWTWLNSQIRSLIVDDLDRLDGQNMFLDKDSGPALADAIAAMDRCLERPDCEQPEFSPATGMFIASNYYYSENLDWIRSQSDLAKKRETMKTVRGYMKNDSSRYVFTPNASVRSEADGKIVLPLLAGPFGDESSRALLTKYIESIWSNPVSQLKVEWKDAGNTSGAFAFLLGESAGERAFVSWSKREITLFPGTRDRTVAHEIGHVLGFRDRYYTVWQPRGCKYLIQSSEADLMSDSNTGKVTDEEWAELRRQYAPESTEMHNNASSAAPILQGPVGVPSPLPVTISAG